MLIFKILNWSALIVPFTYLGLRHYRRAVDNNPEYRMRLTTKYSIVLFVVFLIIMVVVGPEYLEKHLFWRRITAYIIPGVGFAFAAFPYEASELSPHFITDTLLGWNDMYAVIGWTLIAFLALRLLMLAV